MTAHPAIEPTGDEMTRRGDTPVIGHLLRSTGSPVAEPLVRRRLRI